MKEPVNLNIWRDLESFDQLDAFLAYMLIMRRNI